MPLESFKRKTWGQPRAAIFLTNRTKLPNQPLIHENTHAAYRSHSQVAATGGATGSSPSTSNAPPAAKDENDRGSPAIYNGTRHFCCPPVVCRHLAGFGSCLPPGCRRVPGSLCHRSPSRRCGCSRDGARFPAVSLGGVLDEGGHGRTRGSAGPLDYV